MADAGPPWSRIPGLDALRGAAILGMVAYHLAWDLAALGWPIADPASSPGWTAFGGGVAATFLALSGVGVALARPKGLGFALRRLAVLVAAGLLVSAASLWFAPDAPIRFGILQCIAAADALSLAALRLPAAVRLGLAALAAAAPSLLRSPGFDGWLGAALGLSETLPRAVDHRPLLPWLAFALLGTLAGDALARRAPGRDAAPQRIAAPLRWMGRRSLALYLVHQPLLYGALLLVGPPLGGADGDPMDRQCRSDCAAAGAAPSLCAAACACTAERLTRDARPGARLTRGRLEEVEAACRRAGG